MKVGDHQESGSAKCQDSNVGNNNASKGGCGATTCIPNTGGGGRGCEFEASLGLIVSSRATWQKKKKSQKSIHPLKKLMRE